MQCAAHLILTPAAVFRKAGVRGAASGLRDALNKPGGPPSAALPFLPPTGRLGRVRTRQVSKRRRLPPPSRVQRAQPPLGVQRVPLFSKTSEGGAGGEQSVTPRPNGCRGYGRAVAALDRASQRSHPLPLARKHPNAPSGKTPTLPSPKQGAGGCAPAGGTRGVPLFPKTLEAGQVGQRRRPSQTLR